MNIKIISIEPVCPGRYVYLILISSVLVIRQLIVFECKMGLEHKPREQRLKMMKTKASRKTVRKLNRLKSKGKLRKHVVDRVEDIKTSKSIESRKRVHNIVDDYVDERAVKDDSDEEDILPLDMLDADIDWENSAFAGIKRRRLEKEEEEEDEDDLEAQSRRFEGQLEDDRVELLPIKLKDGRVIRPTVKKDDDDEEEEVTGGDTEKKVDPLEGLSAAEIVVKRREMLEEKKVSISSHSMDLLADPQTNILRLRDLFNLCQGQGVHPIIRESVQKLAMASILQVLVDIIPGYPIRSLTEAEQQQKVKKETKKLQTFEEALLRYYLKFLQLCEKNCKRLVPSLAPSSFSSKIGLLSLRSLSRLLIAAPHFNYSTNIVTALTRTVMNGHEEAIDHVCTAFTQLFKEDLHLKMSLFTVKAIHDLVKKRIRCVPAKLLYTFLSLRITKVQNEDKKSGKGLLLGKKARLQKERASKTKRKFDRQLKKLESDLKEVEAAESLSNKLKTATECMKQVFHIYFSILRRMPSLVLLPPVLEGLSKFAHLLNVEFFADMIKCMEELVDQKHLRLLDSLHCVHTVFVILSGDGQALNVDPYRFYKTVYNLMPSLPFEKDKNMRYRESSMLARCLDMMLIARRKQVSTARVAAFARRALLTSVVLDDRSSLPLLAVTRSLFVAHPKLSVLVESLEDEEEGGRTNLFTPDSDDPDSCGAVNSEALVELRRLAKRRHRLVASLARNMLHGVPSTGPHRIDSSITAEKSWKLGEEEDVEKSEESGALIALQNGAKKKKTSLSSRGLYGEVLRLLEADK